MEAEVTTMASGSCSNKLDIGMHCVTCGIHKRRTPRMWECDVCVDYFLCESCYNISMDTSKVPLPAPEVHCRDHPMSAHVNYSICDGCGSEPIWNRRWHCIVCDDFDLCEACYGGLDASDMPLGHVKEHPMIDVEVIRAEKLDIGMECVTCGIHRCCTSRMWECGVCGDYFLCESCYTGSLDNFEVPSATLGVHCQEHSMSAHMHSSFACNGCESEPIWSRRWHCTTCLDFNFCNKCYEGLDASDMPLEHLKEHRMIDVEVKYLDTRLLKFQPKFEKPKDPQWAYKVECVLFLVESDDVANDDDDKYDIDNDNGDDNNDDDDDDDDDDSDEDYSSKFGFLWVKREPRLGALSGMDDGIVRSSSKADEGNSFHVTKLTDQINPNSRTSFPKQPSRANGMCDKKHKVFLSHAGAEKDFVEQLHRDLSRVHHFCTFFDKDDESLPKGETFPKRIFDAAENCELAIVVISHEYFSRKWPMLELAAFVKAQKRRPELKILPIFYRLSVEEFKRQKDLFWKIWNELKLVSKDGMDEWKEALKVISCSNGLEYDKESGEVGLRDRIVEAVYKRVNPELMWDDTHVQGKSQMQEMIQEMIQFSRDRSEDSISRIGLFGVGGCGKTTMCKVLCNQMMPHYLGKVCHIEFGVVDVLQTRVKLLQGICQLESSLLRTVDEGEALTLLKTHISKQRVCLIIDNVSYDSSCIEEAMMLLDLPFKEGSLIVVTSRSSIVLEKLKIGRELRMRIPSLTREAAKALFRYHARCDASSLTDEQMKTMESFVERCNFEVQDMALKEYHPLALKVLGSRVGANAMEWGSIGIDFKFYEDEDRHPLFSILRSSFDALSVKYRQIFLDIALHSGDSTANLRMANLEWQLRSLYGESDDRSGYKVVESFLAKSLVEYYDVESRYIYVHDLYREFARMEVEKKGLQHSGSCCFSRGSKRDHALQEGRVRIHDHPVSHITKDILSCRICSEAEYLSVEYCANLISVDVSGMENLKVFYAIGDCPQLTSINVEGAINLRLLVWSCSEGQFYPNLTSLESLKNLQLLGVKLESPPTPHGCLDFSKNSNLEVLCLSYLPLNLLNLNRAVLLKVLVLENCQHLKRFEGLEALAQLKHLVLRACTSLVVFPSLANFPSLVHFSLHGAGKLKAIHGFANLITLEALKLHGCWELEELLGVEACTKLNWLDLYGTNMRDCSWISPMMDLTFIDLRGTKIRFVPDCSSLCKLSELWLDDCEAIESIGDKTGLIPTSFPQSLQKFSAENCRCLNIIPHFDQGSALRYLDLRGTCVEDVYGLTSCNELEKLFYAKTQIKSLPDLSGFARLQVLDVSQCELLTGMDNIKNLPALEELLVFGCTSLSALPDLQSSKGLMELNLFGCPLVDPNVVKLPSASNIGMDMEDTINDNVPDSNINGNECEDMTAIVAGFQAHEHNHEREELQHLLSWWQWIGSWCGGLGVDMANTN